MSRLILLLLFIQLSGISFSQQQPAHAAKGYYSNPVFAGDYPDPSILRDGDNYYMVHSSFEYYPGLLIWHSKDLINWNPVVNALHRNVGAVWAPDLVKYENRYYIYFPANNTNYVVTADSINGKWSDPVDLKIGNIDPGHVTDENGNRFLFFSNGGMVPLSKDGLRITGDHKPSYSGWPIPRQWSIECFCMEGPKLIRRGDYYYLTVAEGGTAGPATGHMVISARAKSLSGPWENSPFNPITRTTSNKERWCSKGHGTLFEDAKGAWWMILHAYEKGFYNMGRQTLMVPVEWTKDGWYKIPDGVKEETMIKLPSIKKQTSTFSLSDSFTGDQLKPHWKFFGEFDPARFTTGSEGLTLKAKGTGIANSSPLLCNPGHHSFSAEVEISMEGAATAGLIIFYNNTASSGILANDSSILANIRGWQFTTERKAVSRHVYLRMENRKSNVDLFFSIDGKQWKKIENSLEISGFHHNALGGFLGIRIGLCSIGEGAVTFRNFRYEPLGE